MTTEEKLAWAINELADANCVDLDSPEEQAAWLDEYIIERTAEIAECASLDSLSRLASTSILTIGRAVRPWSAFPYGSNLFGLGCP